jgi:hypothetical protein
MLNPSNDHFPATANRQPGDDYRILDACRQCNNRRGHDDTWLTFHVWEAGAHLPERQYHYLANLRGRPIAMPTRWKVTPGG